MKKVVYKYAISGRDIPELRTVERGAPFAIEMIKGAEILSVQAQPDTNYGIPQTTGKIWALCDAKEKATERRVFRLIETGVEFDATNYQHRGTYQLFDGKIVLHLFECML